MWEVNLWPIYGPASAMSGDFKQVTMLRVRSGAAGAQQGSKREIELWAQIAPQPGNFVDAQIC